MAKSGTCEYCGKIGPVEMRFGINYCPECQAAIRTKNVAYFQGIGQGKATKRAIDDVYTYVYPEIEKQNKKRELLEIENTKQKAAIEKAGGYWEYKILSLYDNSTGSLEIASLEGTINDLGKEGWHLRCAFTNELGHNSNSGGIMGLSVGTNATIDQNVLVFERFIWLE